MVLRWWRRRALRRWYEKAACICDGHKHLGMGRAGVDCALCDCCPHIKRVKFVPAPEDEDDW